jgi:hypothetical protein
VHQRGGSGYFAVNVSGFVIVRTSIGHPEYAASGLKNLFPWATMGAGN